MGIGNWSRGTIKHVMAVFTLGLVGLAPFFRGLIFEREMGIHHYLVAMTSIPALLLIFLEFKRHHLLVRQLLTSPYFLALAALTTSYGLSFFQAVNSRDGLFTWLRHLDYLLSFVLVFLSAGIWGKDRQTAFIRLSLTIFAITGAVVAAGGILTGQGILSIHGGLTSGRLSFTFQYPNSLAAYLMATVLIVIYLAVQNTRPLKAGSFAVMGFLTFLAILGSQSRGVWVMLPFIMAIFTLGQTARKKTVLFTTGILGLAIILSNLTVAPRVQQMQPNWCAFLWTLAGCLASGLAWGGYVRRGEIKLRQLVSPAQKSVRRLLPESGGPRKRIVLLGAFCIILIIVGGTALINNRPGGTFNTVISSNPLLKRITQINAEDTSFRKRLVYYNDALKMIKDRPLLGWGGGGWKSGYPAYQSYNYISTTVHNHFLQVWVETGTFGLIMFTVPFLFLSRGLLYLYHIRTTHALAAETWTLGTAALALGMHSIIDFDLSFSSIALLFWALLALFAYRKVILEFGFVAFQRPKLTQESQGSRGYEWSGALVLTVLLLFLSVASIHLAAVTFTLRAAQTKAQEFTLAVQKGDEKAALEYIQAAILLDRWSAQYPMAKAQFLMANIEHNPDPQVKKALAYESLNLARRAVELDSYSPDSRFLLARLYLANGQFENTLSEAEKAGSLQPWFIKTYEELNSIYVNVAVQQLLRGQKDAAGDTLRRVLAVTREAVAKKDTLPPRIINLWDSRSNLTLTPALALTAGQSALLLEDYNQARIYLTRACQADDQKAKAVAQLWLGVTMQKSGDLSGAAIQETARRSSPDVEREYAMIKKLLGW